MLSPYAMIAARIELRDRDAIAVRETAQQREIELDLPQQVRLRQRLTRRREQRRRRAG